MIRTITFHFGNFIYINILFLVIMKLQNYGHLEKILFLVL